jgi:hypothetical protein
MIGVDGTSLKNYGVIHSKALVNNGNIPLLREEFLSS